MTTDLNPLPAWLEVSGAPGPHARHRMLADRLFSSLLGTFDVLSIHIGDQFGLYELLHQSGPLTVVEAAQRSGMHHRYAREWLEQQAVAGLIEVEDAAHPSTAPLRVSDAHAAVLCDPESLAYIAPFARMLAAAVQMPHLMEAYRRGGGVGWSDYGELMRTAQAEANRPLFLKVLGTDWLPRCRRWTLPAQRRQGRRHRLRGRMVLDRHRPGLPRGHRRGVRRRRGLGRAARGNAASYGLSERVTFSLVDAASVPVRETTTS